MLILYSVDTSLDRRPIANWLIFALLIMVFVIQASTLRQVTEEAKRTERYKLALRGGEIDDAELAKAVEVEAANKWVMQRFVLKGWDFVSLICNSWLHLSIFLLIFNLIFLWPMGNAVCAQIGNWRYLAIFLLVNLFGGLAHLLISSEPASGIGAAMACVAGMYLVFFPEIPMNCLLFFPRPETVGLSTYFVVPFWFAADLTLSLVGLQGVTYLSHFLAFFAGISMAMVALKNKWVEMGTGERSLIDVLDKRKVEVEEAIKETNEFVEEEKKEVLLERPAESAVLEALPGAKKITPENTQQSAGAKKEEDFIRFYCVCGQRIKVPKGYEGKAGRCPKCKSLVRIP